MNQPLLSGGEDGDAARPPRNQLGQKMGPKGHATRERLLDALLHLLATHPLREIKASHITRIAGAAPSRFSFYFSDVEDALLAALMRRPQASPELMTHLEKNWADAHGNRTIHDFLREYIAYWERNYDLLKARNLAADEGDTRFLELRRQQAAPIRNALARKIAAAQAAGLVPDDLHPNSVAGILLASLERLVAITRYPQSESGVTAGNLLEAAAYLLAAATGSAFR